EGGVCVIYEDDGATRAHQRGQYALTEIRSSFADGAALIEISPVSGEYDGQPAARDLTVRIWSSARPSGVQARVGNRDVQFDPVAHLNDEGSTYWLYEPPTWTEIHLPQVGR